MNEKQLRESFQTMQPPKPEPTFVVGERVWKMTHAKQSVVAGCYFAVGDRVWLKMSGGYDHLGVIESVKPYYRSLHRREEPLYTVHKHDFTTGKLMVCPDEGCRLATTHRCCPICGWNAWADQLAHPTQTDLDFYRAEGMIRE